LTLLTRGLTPPARLVGSDEPPCVFCRRGHGLYRPGPGGNALARRRGPRKRCPALAVAGRESAFLAKSEERDLDLSRRRDEPHGELRSQAGPQRALRQDDRRVALQGRPRLALPQEKLARICRQQSQGLPDHLSVAGRL